jgi:uncharacterized protein with ParB-like and HNH nuclease domain
MTQTQIKLISIPELFDKTFIVGSYQRGYRWDERQVLDLLNDILEFQSRYNRKPGEFYCLQPLVVKKHNNDQNEYEVIDGQQRLTTIFLILTFLKDRLKEDYYIDNIYRLKYETRPGSEDFLKRISSIETEDKDNIDYYYISKAFLCIKNWFEEKIKQKRITKADFANALLKVDMQNDRDLANNVRFIWYEAEDDDAVQDAAEIFTRINMGKIPLTSAELIKAILFIKESEEDRENHQFKRAYEWENIERALQEDKFWYFLNRQKNDIPTRIEFIFDLIANKYEKLAAIEVDRSIDTYYIFYIFNELISKKIDVHSKQIIESERQVRDSLWDEVKTYHRMFDEWFYSDEYYHLTGYLIHSETKIEDIINSCQKKDKIEFKNWIKIKIKKSIKFPDKNSIGDFLKELEYDRDYKDIREILLLFNVLLAKESRETRFSFDRFVQEKWTLEHIHAQNSEAIRKDSQRRLLLEDQLDYFRAKGDIKRVRSIEELLKGGFKDEKKFKTLQDEIYNSYSDEVNVHSIDNLALLSSFDNSALSNNIFPIKREKIIELDRKGKFVPIGTKNVFLKYFSKNAEQMVRWEKADRDAYLESLIETLEKYFKERQDLTSEKEGPNEN